MVLVGLSALWNLGIKAFAFRVPKVGVYSTALTHHIGAL